MAAASHPHALHWLWSHSDSDSFLRSSADPPPKFDREMIVHRGKFSLTGVRTIGIHPTVDLPLDVLTRAFTWLLLISLMSGCTAVMGQIQPLHFQFITTVKQDSNISGGWRVACVHAKIKNGTTGDFFFCKFGVELPIENMDGPISTPLAQRIAADCANEAAYLVLEEASTQLDPPLGLLCESFKKTYRLRLGAAIPGSRVMTVCDPSARPVMLGHDVP